MFISKEKLLALKSWNIQHGVLFKFRKYLLFSIIMLALLFFTKSNFYSKNAFFYNAQNTIELVEVLNNKGYILVLPYTSKCYTCENQLKMLNTNMYSKKINKVVTVNLDKDKDLYDKLEIDVPGIFILYNNNNQVAKADRIILKSEDLNHFLSMNLK